MILCNFQVSLVILSTFANKLVMAMDDFMKFQEGSCQKVARSLGQDERGKMDSFKYIVGGSKFVMYGIGSNEKGWAQMSNEEFIRNACYWRNTTTTHDSVASLFGFGETQVTLNIHGNPQGFYIESSPGDASGLSDTQAITMTDHETFAVMLGCLKPLNKRSWLLISNNPGVSEETKKLVEQHVVGTLGFDPQNFVYLDYSSCRMQGFI